MSILWTVLLSVGLIISIFAICFTADWCFSKTIAKGCDICKRYPLGEIGDHFNITYLMMSAWHFLFWRQRKMHKQFHREWQHKWGFRTNL